MMFLNSKERHINDRKMLDYKNWLQVNNLKDDFNNFYEYVDNKDFNNIANLYM